MTDDQAKHKANEIVFCLTEYIKIMLETGAKFEDFYAVHNELTQSIRDALLNTATEATND